MSSFFAYLQVFDEFDKTMDELNNILDTNMDYASVLHRVKVLIHSKYDVTFLVVYVAKK